LFFSTHFTLTLGFDLICGGKRNKFFGQKFFLAVFDFVAGRTPLILDFIDPPSFGRTS
jgi:hypothetical protein